MIIANTNHDRKSYHVHHDQTAKNNIYLRMSLKNSLNGSLSLSPPPPVIYSDRYLSPPYFTLRGEITFTTRPDARGGFAATSMQVHDTRLY